MIQYYMKLSSSPTIVRIIHIEKMYFNNAQINKRIQFLFSFIRKVRFIRFILIQIS